MAWPSRHFTAVVCRATRSARKGGSCALDQVAVGLMTVLAERLVRRGERAGGLGRDAQGPVGLSMIYAVNSASGTRTGVAGSRGTPGWALGCEVNDHRQRPFTHKLRRKLLRVWVAPVGPEGDRGRALTS